MFWCQIWGQYHVTWNKKKTSSKTLAGRQQEHGAKKPESQSQRVFSLAKWRRVVQSRNPAVQSPNTRARLQLCRSQRTSWRGKLTIWVCICVRRREKDKRSEAAILSADAVSPFSGLTLKEVSFPLDTIRLSNNTDAMCKSQNTVPLKPFGCWQGPRRWLTCAAFGERGSVLVMSPYLSR